MITEEPGELVMGPVTHRVDLDLGADYEKAHTKVLEVDGSRYFRLLDTLELLLDAPPLAPVTIRPRTKRGRKDGKRLRYAAEAATPVNPKNAARLADAARGVQKVLGDHQDSVVTRDLLRRLGAEAFVHGENGFSYGQLHALEQAVALESEARFHRQWKKFPSASL